MENDGRVVAVGIGCCMYVRLEMTYERDKRQINEKLTRAVGKQNGVVPRRLGECSLTRPQRLNVCVAATGVKKRILWYNLLRGGFPSFTALLFRTDFMNEIFSPPQSNASVCIQTIKYHPQRTNYSDRCGKRSSSP